MTVEISSPAFGNIGNKMMQYMFCKKLESHIPKSMVTDICIDEFNIRSAPARISDSQQTLELSDRTDIAFDQLANYTSQFDNIKLFLAGFFQKLELFPDVETARQLFQSDIKLEETFSDDELIINIRCGELVSGHVSWYPILPVAFYKHIVDISGLKPVFVGQLDNPHYMAEIKSAFPNARYIPSKGALYDFQLVRSARNIAISVSTFSWLAAWLSHAKNIFYPLAGFLNPALQKAYEQVELFTNLAPTQDSRFRFYQMPFFFNEEITSLIEFHRHFDGIIYEVPSEYVERLKQAPFITRKHLPSYIPLCGRVNSLWYLKTYPLAALEIAEGFYSSTHHHYAEIGWKRGYSPVNTDYVPAGSILVSEQGHANESSFAPPWAKGNSTQEDAHTLINGSSLIENYNHTQAEKDPWWQVDLKKLYDLSSILIFNRIENPAVENRLFPFIIQISEDGITFKNISIFETYNFPKDKLTAYQFSPPQKARYIKIVLLGEQRMLSIRQIQVYAKP